MTSVSVSEVNAYPSPLRRARTGSWFSMMPLCTTASWPEMCGWAFFSLGAPCVAQRVCAIPVTPPSFCAATCAASSATRPAALTRFSAGFAPSPRTATPAES